MKSKLYSPSKQLIHMCVINRRHPGEHLGYRAKDNASCRSTCLPVHCDLVTYEKSYKI